MENPKTSKEMVDAAWNYVEQARLAMMVGDKKHLETAISEASRLLGNAMEKMEEEDVTAPTPPPSDDL